MGSIEKAIRWLDVLIVGGGPVGASHSPTFCSTIAKNYLGLITAFQLAKFGHASSVAIIEKHPKSSHDQYGRANDREGD